MGSVPSGEANDREGYEWAGEEEAEMNIYRIWFTGQLEVQKRWEDIEASTAADALTMVSVNFQQAFADSWKVSKIECIQSIQPQPRKSGILEQIFGRS